MEEDRIKIMVVISDNVDLWCSLNSAIVILQNLRKEADEKNLIDPQLTIERSRWDEGDHYECYGYRWETDEEYNKRKEQETTLAERKKIVEYNQNKATYERLKKIFEMEKK